MPNAQWICMVHGISWVVHFDILQHMQQWQMVVSWIVQTDQFVFVTKNTPPLSIHWLNREHIQPIPSFPWSPVPIVFFCFFILVRLAVSSSPVDPLTLCFSCSFTQSIAPRSVRLYLSRSLPKGTFYPSFFCVVSFVCVQLFFSLFFSYPSLST